jgi:Gas vesicle synthesis protein GvpO
VITVAGKQEQSGPPRDEGELTAAGVGEVALEHIAGLTGKETVGVTFVEPTDDGWQAGVEIVEDARVPSSSDLLAVYQADLDPDGELLAYRRIQRYPRGSSRTGTGDGAQ